MNSYLSSISSRFTGSTPQVNYPPQQQYQQQQYQQGRGYGYGYSSPSPQPPPPSSSSGVSIASTASTFSSSISSSLTSRLTSLRRALTNSNSESDDPSIDSEDSSHVSDVLRAYYSEKGRLFPDWLPPDPRKPPPPVIAPPPSSVGQGYGNLGGYGGGAYGQRNSGGQAAGGKAGGGLGDLWGEPSANSVPQQPPAPQSLRRGPARGQAHTPNISVTNAGGGPVSPPPGPARPLPSQRAGSYQSASSATSQREPKAQERLRARLQGGGGQASGRDSPSAYQSKGGYYTEDSYGGGYGAAPGNYGASGGYGGSGGYSNGGGGTGGGYQSSSRGENFANYGGYGGGGGYSNSNPYGSGDAGGKSTASGRRAGMMAPPAGAGGGLPSGPRLKGPR